MSRTLEAAACPHTVGAVRWRPVGRKVWSTHLAQSSNFVLLLRGVRAHGADLGGRGGGCEDLVRLPHAERILLQGAGCG